MVFPGAAVYWSGGVMEGPIQVEIRAFAFANTPILQYSKTELNELKRLQRAAQSF